MRAIIADAVSSVQEQVVLHVLTVDADMSSLVATDTMAQAAYAGQSIVGAVETLAFLDCTPRTNRKIWQRHFCAQAQKSDLCLLRPVSAPSSLLPNFFFNPTNTSFMISQKLLSSWWCVTLICKSAHRDTCRLHLSVYFVSVHITYMLF